jgi:hypothetical protein
MATTSIGEWMVTCSGGLRSQSISPASKKSEEGAGWMPCHLGDKMTRPVENWLRRRSMFEDSKLYSAWLRYTGVSPSSLLCGFPKISGRKLREKLIQLGLTDEHLEKSKDGFVGFPARKVMLEIKELK